MSVYAKIAKRYGANVNEPSDVDEFFLKVVPTLPATHREQIFNELMSGIGSGGSIDLNWDEPPTEIPLLPLDDRTVSNESASKKGIRPNEFRASSKTRASSRGSIDDRLNGIIRELIANHITLEMAVEAFEGKYIVAAMSASRGDVTQASKSLGVHRNTLHNKLRSQTMLNGFADSIRPTRRRLSANARRSPASAPRKKTT
jgi:DNA-binding protein Fis